MTGREWRPGDVAMVTVGCEANRHATDLWASSDPAIVTARPLVVIDPEDRGQVERLLNLIDDCFNDVRVDGTGPTAVDLAQVRLREFASPTPTKPDEPGTWGVVEASCVHSARRLHWMRHADDNWWPFAPYGEDDRRPLPDDWDSLVDPVVVRDGVAGEPS